MLEGRQRKLDRTAKQNRSSPSVKPKDSSVNDNNFRSPNECNTMTRKPIRTRRPRIPILQSGYCAICNLPYNSVEDHIQSKKHQKLIGEDANYIALNGYIHSDVGIESLLSLTGIDAIGFDDFTSPKAKRRRTMPRTRASSVASDIVKPETGHRLRSRKNINYMTPPLEDDSLQDKPDLEPVRLQYKEYRELRSSTRALAKLTAIQSNGGQEVWDSGRPKRACIGRQKRISADERLVVDNKTYYKVEVLSNKLRSSDKGTNKQPKESKPEETDKGLIVKFKKLRNSELIQLNNEATNFLFPKKDESTDEEEEDGTENGMEHNTDEKESVGTENNDVSSSSELGEIRLSENFKVEDETSMDSVSSDFKKPKKRRSHAEAFIMDNQKYYKFETPCSRLRYHGSYLSPLPVKPNGDCVTKTEIKNEPKREQTEHEKEKEERLKLNLDEFKFSFETVPRNEKWYKTFQRQDRSEQRYDFGTNYYWDDFVMPYQIPHLKPVDPKTCYHTYKDLSKAIQEALNQSHVEELLAESDTNLTSETIETPTENAEEKEKETNVLIEQTDEDSKLSEVSVAPSDIAEEVVVPERRIGRPRKGMSLSPSGSTGRNPRKSPRQHASTLAILSSLIQQRKRRSRNAGTTESPASLPVIPEEPAPAVEEKTTSSSPQKLRKKKVDYFAIAAAIDEELNTALESNFDEDFEPTTDPDFVSFKESNLTVDDIMTMYDDRNAKENASTCRKFFNKAPRRKPGKRKKNKTGWPNKVKRRKLVKEGEQEGVSEEVNRNESDDDNDNEDENEDSDSIIELEGNQKELAESSHDDLDVNQDRENNCDKVAANRVGNSSKIRDTILQPYVYVKKLESYEHPSVKKLIRSSRRVRPQRRKVTASPKSPRILRRPKGRWYRER